MKTNSDCSKRKEEKTNKKMKALKKRTPQLIKWRYDRTSIGVRLLLAHIHEKIAKRTKLRKDMNRTHHEKQNDENKKENWRTGLDVQLDYFAATATVGWILLLPLNLFCLSSFKRRPCNEAFFGTEEAAWVVLSSWTVFKRVVGTSDNAGVSDFPFDIR